MDELYRAMGEAAEEYERDYKPLVEAKLKEKVTNLPTHPQIFVSSGAHTTHVS